MGGSGPVLKPAHTASRRDCWVVECLGFAFHGRLSDVATVIAGYKVTLRDRAGAELFTAPLTMFETKWSDVTSMLIAGQGVMRILYIFDPHLISPTHPIAYLNAIRPDTPILKDNLRMDAMLVTTRMFHSE